MIVKRKLFSSFIEWIKGNPKLKESLINHSRTKRVDPAIFNDCKEFKKFDKNIQSYLTWLSQNIVTKDEPLNFGMIRLFLICYEKIVDGITKNKPYFSGEIKPKYPRVVFGWIGNGSTNILLLYYDIKKDIVVLKEENISVIGQTLNEAFGVKENKSVFRPSEIFDIITNIDKV